MTLKSRWGEIGYTSSYIRRFGKNKIIGFLEVKGEILAILQKQLL